MLFNSFTFIILFLPLSVVAFWQLPSHPYTKSIPRYIILLIFSSVFYLYSGFFFFLLLLISTAVNYLLSYYSFVSISLPKSKFLLLLSVILNLCALFFYKYLFFFLSLFLEGVPGFIIRNSIVLPLGISFYTFQQIAFHVDCFNKHTKPPFEFPSYWKYLLFVSFFPQLIAGPIVHFSFISKYINNRFPAFSYPIFIEGLTLFSIGLSKKVLLADSLIPLTSYFDHILPTSELHPFPSILAIFAYTLQLYLDFSGYCDMARGIAKFFGFDLPVNFDSPYKSTGIQEFWRRWHITLGDFLRDYIYIPLGGSRLSESSTYFNLLITFLIGGLWHGAGFTFIIWGALHGAALIFQRLCNNLFFIPYKKFNILFTFLFVSIAWIFFRSPNLSTAISVLKSLSNYTFYLPLHDLSLNKLFDYQLFNISSSLSVSEYILFVLALLCLVFYAPNSSEIAKKSANPIIASYSALLLVLSLALLNSQSSEFLYFNF